ncbi:unnamed protein product [Linum trigynum]|uniref:Transposase-associated domain-containing protein n=1 Tax=Linum trigynum TaxID=586398 RepID=A0AAV2FLR2_9ROSI
MDRIWISESNRLSGVFIQGVVSFIEFARSSVKDGKIACPCQRCVNRFHHTTSTVMAHILENGFSQSYTNWYFHGETISQSDPIPNRSDVETENVEGCGNIQHNVQEFMEDMATGYAHVDGFQSMSGDQGSGHSSHTEILNNEAGKFYDILEDMDEKLFDGCTNQSKLSFILELFHLKCMNGLSNKAFNDLLSTLRETLPEGQKLPKSSYEIKKLIGKLGLGYEKIDVCPNNCMLFWRENIKERECLQCGESRYVDDESRGPDPPTKKRKKKEKPKKVLWWFPLKPRLQRLFMCSKTASLMRWHFDKRVDDGCLRHPADARAWKDFDARYPDFAKEPRNIRLGLATDGFNPFRNLSSTHSTWPVLLTIYNWAPWLCMKQHSMILSLLIPGPHSPGDKIDVFLEPLIVDLHDLWVHGMQTYDAQEKKMFQLHAALMWTINDFPAYSMLSGWRTRTKFACPNCGFDTWSKWLHYGGKYCYMGHRRFLGKDHPFRYHAEEFDGTEEHREAPAMTSGTDILRRFNGETIVTDLDDKVVPVGDGLTKKSVFFQLPYWEFNLVRHNLDVMHIEKNVCDNILGTLLDIEGKSKDNLKARMDMKEMGIRTSLHPVERSNGKTSLPDASYTMLKIQKERMLSVLKAVKVPDGYSSNMSGCVNMKERKLVGLKSHDCHVLMQDLLSIAIRGCLPEKESRAIIDLCRYFKGICSKVLKVDYLEELECEIIRTLCNMEMIFPPSFFTVMVHLVSHLATEAKLAGPVHYRWMYPVER